MTSQLNVDTIVDKAGYGGTNIKVGNDATYVARWFCKHLQRCRKHGITESQTLLSWTLQIYQAAQTTAQAITPTHFPTI